MPSLDRIYRLWPTGVGAAQTVWASHTFGSGLATVGQQIDLAGVLYAPLSTVVLRIRWRNDITTDTRWEDEDGRYWRTNEILEVGRRRFLDVSISTYDLPDTTPAALLAWPEGQQPVGWHIQWRTQGPGVNDVPTPGQYVAELVVRNSFVFGNQRLFDALIPSPGWGVASGITRWLDPSNLSIPATSQGSTLSSIGLYTAERESASLVASSNFNSGRPFPTPEGAGFAAYGSGFAIPGLEPGARIQIAERT